MPWTEGVGWWIKALGYQGFGVSGSHLRGVAVDVHVQPGNRAPRLPVTHPHPRAGLCLAASVQLPPGGVRPHHRGAASQRRAAVPIHPVEEAGGAGVHGRVAEEGAEVNVLWCRQ